MKDKLRGAPLWALGAMSGTSLDGVDAALVQTDGQRILAFGESGYRPYTSPERAALKAALGRWPGEDTDAALEVVQGAHAELLTGFPQAELDDLPDWVQLHSVEKLEVPGLQEDRHLVIMSVNP